MKSAATNPGPAKRPRLFRARRPRDGRRRRAFDLRKALFILPNAFTVSPIFCGFWAILQATSGRGADGFIQGKPVRFRRGRATVNGHFESVSQRPAHRCGAWCSAYVLSLRDKRDEGSQCWLWRSSSCSVLPMAA